MVKKGWVMIFNIHEFDSNPLTFINIYDPKPFQTIFNFGLFGYISENTWMRYGFGLMQSIFEPNRHDIL